MAVSRDEILADIKAAFPKAVVELTPLVDDDNHWKLTIAAYEFHGHSLVEQHQMVHRALKGKLGEQLHALQLITKLL
ncbi:MAG: BolA/IbaG family iron-sulfur metabolism protein [Alphaproteobacteria bacterium]